MGSPVNKIDDLNAKRVALTTRQIDNTYKYVTEILGNLTDKALQELISGYDNDLNKLLNELLMQTSSIINFNAESLESEKLDYLEYLEKSMDEQFKIMSYNYFKSTSLTNFTQHVRNIEWGNLVQLYPWSAYLCCRGSGKSNPAGTEIVMYDGTLRKVEDIKIGDQVMGQDSTPRNVLSVHSGVDDMYEITQANALTYGTNSRHILHYKRGGYEIHRDKKNITRWKTIFDDAHTQIIEMSAKEFHDQSNYYKEKSFGYRVRGWELKERKQLIEPYFLGIWLGDGTSTQAYVTNIDKEIIDYMRDYAQRIGMLLNQRTDHYTYAFSRKRGDGRNLMLDYLRHYNLVSNKHIPEDYLLGSRQQRLELLAGLVDSDGTSNKRRKSYSITQKNRILLEQIQQLCWSLGFRANISVRHAKMNYKNNEIYTSYTLHFSGHIWEIPCRVERKIIKQYTRIQDSQRSKLNSKKVGKGEYFGFECDGDHLFLLKDGTVLHNSFEMCYSFPLWRLFSYRRPHPLIQDSKDNLLRKETCIITNESRLANLHVGKIVEEIRINDILAQKLNPTGKADLGKESIKAENGAILHRRSYGSAIRGLHVGAAVTDDFLDKSCLYSKDQRDKYHEVFYAEIKNIVDQGGYNIVSGTPFHQQDLYGDLMKDNIYKVFTYPGILPNKEILAPDRFTFDYLMDLKKSLGSIVFAREILVSPISDQSSLFPWEYLKNAFIGMENIGYVDNIDSFPIKIERVVIGCDFAISGKIGADYTVYTVWGRDKQKNYYLMHVWRKMGASHEEQISQIISLDSRFKPNKIICEANGFQSILSDMARGRGLRNIEEFTTTSGIKKDLYNGLPSLSALFERGVIKMPYKDKEEDRNTTNWLCGEFNSVTFNETSGKLESSDQHDDGVLSSFFSINELREKDRNLEMFLI